MESRLLSLPGGREVELNIVGPEEGRTVVYFHSPSTLGEELVGAQSAAAQHHLRLITLRRPSIACDEPSEFVGVVAKEIAAVVDALTLEGPSLLAWSGGAPYALAASAVQGSVIDSVHLVSPVPGPLTGPRCCSQPVGQASAGSRYHCDVTMGNKWIGASRLPGGLRPVEVRPGVRFAEGHDLGADRGRDRPSPPRSLLVGPVV